MPFLRRRWLAVQPISSIQGCSSGGTAWAVSWPPIQSVSSVSTTLRPRRTAARAPATPPVPHPRPERPSRSPKPATPLRARPVGTAARLPLVMDLFAHVALVDLPRSLHNLLRERRHLGCGDVVLDLCRVLAARDGAGDGRVHEDPTQGELREGVSFGYELLQFFGGQETRLEIHAGERLAPVEGLPLAVEVAVVVFREHAVRTHLAREEAAGEGYACQDADVAFSGEREELLFRLLAEDVEYDLDGRDARIIEGHLRLLDLLHAHAVVTNLSCFLQPVKRLEGRVLTVDFRWRAVEQVSISQSPVLSRYSLFQSVAPDDLRVPAGARLGDAPLRSVLHEHDTEPLGVPFGPLEVIQERPHHVTAQVDAPIHRLVGCPEVGVQIRDALLVVHVALGVNVVVDGTPVLGYVDGQVCIFFLDPDQYLRQAFRLHRPAHSSLLRRVRDNRTGVEVGEGHALLLFLRRVADGVTEVVVDTQEVDGNGDTDEIIVVDEREVYAPLSVV